MKIFGTILTNRFSWSGNWDSLVKKVNARMQIPQKVWSFGSTIEEIVGLCKVYCLSVLDQSCVLWSDGLTNENKSDLEKTQKMFAKTIHQDNSNI